MSQPQPSTGRHPLKRPTLGRPGLEALEDRLLLNSAPLVDVSRLAVSTSYDSEHILVRYRQGVTPVALAHTTLGSAVDATAGLYKVQLDSGLSVADALSVYNADARVALAEPDYHLRTSAVAHDDRVADQWAVRNTGKSGGKSGADLGLTQAWNVTTGSTKMVVSIMDTGVDYSHPDLAKNIWLNQGEIPASRRARLTDVNRDGLITFHDLNNPVNQGVGKITDINRNGFIDAEDVLAPMGKDSRGKDTGKGGWADRVSNDRDSFVDDLVGWNFHDDNNRPDDLFGHGTHVAGILGAVGDNGIGIAGVNWSVQMMPIKFLDEVGDGSVSDFIAGLNYAVAHGAKVSNNSWTGANASGTLKQAIEAARNRGHIFVAAAGNYDKNNDREPAYPSGFTVDNVVSVAASDRGDKLASFSNYGARSVTMAAPGVDIMSTTMGGGYAYNSGTSMATPQVSGVMALVWSRNPGWTYKQVIQKVVGSVEKVAALSGKTKTGGRVDAANALAGSTSAPVSKPEVSSVSAPRITGATWSGSSTKTINKVRVTFDRAMAISSFKTGDVRLTNPKGQWIAVSSVRSVSGTGDRTFDVFFAQQSAAGKYTMKVGPEVFDTRQTKMAIWTGTYTVKLATPAPAPAPAPITKTYVSNLKVNVPKKGRGVSLLTITDNVRISDVNVKVNLTHPHLSDLYIHLQGPDGTNVVLFNRMGGRTANLVNTVFDDGAGKHSALGKGPYTGSFVPVVPLNNFNGKLAKGTWKLWIEDRGGHATGTLTNWSLIVKRK